MTPDSILLYKLNLFFVHKNKNQNQFHYWVYIINFFTYFVFSTIFDKWFVHVIISLCITHIHYMKSYLIILSFHLYITNFNIQQPTEMTLGYRVINMELLKAFLVNTVICKFCRSSSGPQLWETPENSKFMVGQATLDQNARIVNLTKRWNKDGCVEPSNSRDSNG